MRGNNERKGMLMLIGILVVCIVILAGCCTCRRNRQDTTDIIAGNSHATGKLEATVAELDRATADSRERITNIIETSRGITDGVERVEYLFGQYEREVERLLNEVDRIRKEAENKGENNIGRSGTVTVFYRNPGFSADFEAEIRNKDTLLAESFTLN